MLQYYTYVFLFIQPHNIFTCFKDTVAHILVMGASVFGLHLRLSCTIFTGTRLLGCFWSESSNWCFTTCVTCEVCTLTGWNWERSGSNCFSWFNNTEVTFGTTNVDSYVFTSVFFRRLSEKSHRHTVSGVYYNIYWVVSSVFPSSQKTVPI